MKKPNAIYSGACATVNTDFVFAAVQGEEFILGSSNKERKKQQKIKNTVRETFRMELSQHRSSSAQSSDYMVCFHAAISLHEYSILENGTVLKDFSASTSFFFVSSSKHLICCFLIKRVKLLAKVRKKIVAHVLSRTPISPFLLPLGILLVCYTMGRHCKGSLTDLKIKKSKVFFLYPPAPSPPPKKWMDETVRP